MPPIYFPSDEFVGRPRPDLDRAADYLELRAALSRTGQSFSSDIVDVLEQASEDEYPNVDDEITTREEVANGAVNRIGSRWRVLEEAYPFEFDTGGDTVTFTGQQLNLGRTAYLVSLLLSNLRAVSPLLQDPGVHPCPAEVSSFRQHFQYFATAAIAAEVQGPAWSFGSPRPDGSGFLPKLSQIWEILKDGAVEPQPGAPERPQDDGVDVFAWREHVDGLPGFLLVAAQVATGGNWKDKSIKNQVADVFRSRWFHPEPVTAMVPYHVIPFARPDVKFRDDVRVVGNLLHRLRVPRRVLEAGELVKRDNVTVEAFDRLGAAAACVETYMQRVRAA